jgi:hypothetical protein
MLMDTQFPGYYRCMGDFISINIDLMDNNVRKAILIFRRDKLYLTKPGTTKKEIGENKKQEKGTNGLSANKNFHPSNIQVIHK